MIEIKLTDEAFDKIRKNMDGGIFVSFPPEVSKGNVLENDNPSTEELQERINSLYKRFQKFKAKQKNLGIEQINFMISLNDQISALLDRNITDDKSIVEAIKQAESTMLKLEREVAFINAIENPTKPTKEQYQNHLRKVIAGLNPEKKKQIQQNVEKMLEKQIENTK